MKYLFYFISFIFPALCSSAQPAERDSSIYIASSRLYRMGESLVVSMQVDITRQIPSNESVILIPRLSDSLDNFIQLPAIYVNGLNSIFSSSVKPADRKKTMKSYAAAMTANKAYTTCAASPSPTG